MGVKQSLLRDELGQTLTADCFEYGSQPLGPDEIRVLVLRPDRFQDNQRGIHCDLVRMNLAATEQFGLKKHPFVALSYVWGLEMSKQPVFINGKRKEVTQNLYNALFHIRDVLSPVTLWVDAVCINQNDKAEKPLQLVKMTTIYRQASTVLLWLGPTEGVGSHNGEVSKGDFKLAATHLASVEDMYNSICEQEQRRGGDNAWLRVLSKDPKRSPPLQPVLEALFSLPLWKRVWIMQEIVLAGSNAFMLWGRQVISFKVMDELLKVQERFRPVDGLSADPPISLKRHTMAVQIIGLRFKKEVRFLEALLAVRSRWATNAHDYIYGLLGFVEGAHLIKPDYDKPIQDLFVEAFDCILQQETNLDVLSACSRGWQECAKPLAERTGPEEWPTWLPDWAWTANKPPLSDGVIPADLIIMTGIRCLLLDSRDDVSIDFNACGEKQVAKVSRSGAQLTVRGIDFDSVKEIITGGEGPDYWIYSVKAMWDRGLLHNVYKNLKALKHACERTWLYGHRPKAHMPYNMKALKEALGDVEAEDSRERGADGTMDDMPAACEPFDEEEEVKMSLTDFDPHKEMMWYSYSQQRTGYYCITKRGYLGRSPKPPRVGDLICVFYGGKVPFLLRPQATTGYFKVAGEIYIYGIMKGAAMGAVENQAKDFILV